MIRAKLKINRPFKEYAKYTMIKHVRKIENREQYEQNAKRSLSKAYMYPEQDGLKVVLKEILLIFLLLILWPLIIVTLTQIVTPFWSKNVPI